MNAQLNLPPPPEIVDLSEIASRFDKAITATLEPKLDALVGKQVLFNSDEKDLSPLEGWESRIYNYNIDVIKNINKPAIVAAMDSSCVFIGETAEGSIYSAKCGLALACVGKPLMHFKIGPMLFYMNNDIISAFNIDERLWKFVLFDTSAAKRMIRVRIERVIQNEIAKFLTNAIILIDGSLKKSVFEDNLNGFNNILLNCEANENHLIGISKTTRLKVLDQMASSLMRMNSACYTDVSAIVKSVVSNVLGKPLLAKLCSDGLVLRIDVSNEPRESLGRLITNDVIPNGYPETLRLAHHVSIFTTTDLTCLKSFILSRLGVREMMYEDVRRTLLGAFL
ncbi:MAG: hypothetical protein QXU32_11635 [Nitrososphaerales archaeon]